MESIQYIIIFLNFIFCLLVILGLCWSVMRPLLRFFASPIYKGFYMMEGTIGIHMKMKFNLPKDGDKRLFMDLLSTLSITIMMIPIYRIVVFLQANRHSVITEKEVFSLQEQITGLRPMSWWVLNAVLLIIIYAISRTVQDEEDEKIWHDKITSLQSSKKLASSITGLFKTS